MFNNYCLACGSTKLILQLDFGSQPLANSYLPDRDHDEKTYPLAVQLCKKCYHLQLNFSVPQEEIYKNYLYLSGTSNTLSQYCDWFASHVTKEIGKVGSVIDIGCNDGTQLDYFKNLGWDTYGIDPAENIFNISSVKHTIWNNFFTRDAISLINKTFDVIIAQNVMAHNPSPLEFLLNCKALMNDDSTIYVQTSQCNMILNNEFDTIYHEHINFFNLQSMMKLCERAGLHLVDMKKTPIHGTSYVFVIKKSPLNVYNIAKLMSIEYAAGLYQKNTYDLWAQKVNDIRLNLIKIIEFYRNDGFKLIGYGAAAKGNTLLNFTKIQLDFIIDDNPLKQNLYTPGMKINIKSINSLDTLDINEKVLFIPLAWNFFNEIKSKILSKRSNPNDKFLIYFPEVKIDDI